MTKEKTLIAIGLMSGTSLDGIDAALILTDGEHVEVCDATSYIPYKAEMRIKIKSLNRPDPQNVDGYAGIVKELTMLNVKAVEEVLKYSRLTRAQIGVIGFHGQTVFHMPEAHLSIQLGDGKLLAKKTGIPVVGNMRAADIKAGGQGAPLTPLYHLSLSRACTYPVGILNIGGVANLTWIGETGANMYENIVAFDTGPGNALIDDWVCKQKLGSHDVSGRIAAKGHINSKILSALLSHTYFNKIPPKSLDRNQFCLSSIVNLTPEDGAATLTAFTAHAVKKGLYHVPEYPNKVLVCGGGRKNEEMMRMLTEILNIPVEPVENVGWSGDYIEAEAFAYLAVRSLYGKILSLPSTTGVDKPLTGGTLFHPM